MVGKVGRPAAPARIVNAEDVRGWVGDQTSAGQHGGHGGASGGEAQLFAWSRQQLGLLGRLRRDGDLGAVAVEYVLIAALVAVALLGAAQTLGGQIGETFEWAAYVLDGALEDGGPPGGGGPGGGGNGPPMDCPPGNPPWCTS